MKNAFRNALQNRDAHIGSLRFAVGVLGAICLFISVGWYNAAQDITVHIPPDLRAGSTRQWSDIPLPNVYSFGVRIFSQINRWPTDGATDYKNNLHTYKWYLTPQCRGILAKDHETRSRKGELSGRERALFEVPGRGFDDSRVISHSQDSWTINADLQLKEYVKGTEVKSSLARWPLRVVRYDVDINNNPWGLALDCFDGVAREINVTQGAQ
ncbi:PFL_4703 family integrating conjugative element protein [Shewanella colwelliana]|uniref:PFL_4703 family integrating conjugative element protein n=1 Tax=Shewanella colwelliana TaxID=23 RepID=UPI0037360A56